MSYSDSVLVLYSYTPGDVPSAGDMQRPGRFAINYADGKIFYLDLNGVVQQLVVPMGVAAGLTIDNIGDATVTGKALVRAANAAAVRTLLSLIPGTAAGNLIQLDGAAKLPAVDGSQLTNLPTGSGGVPNDGSVTTVKLADNSVTTAKIVDKNVTLAKLADIAAATILGNNGGAASTPTPLTPAQVKTLLAIAASDVSGLPAASTAALYWALTNNTNYLTAKTEADAIATTALGTIGASLALNFNNGMNFSGTSSANLTLGQHTNIHDQAPCTLEIISGGSYTLAVNTTYNKFIGGIVPTLSTAAGARDILYGTQRIISSVGVVHWTGFAKDVK